MQTLKSHAFALLPVLALALAGCSGTDGVPGPAGQPGAAAQGALSGTATYFICPSFASDPSCANGAAAGAKTVPATGVSVKLVPDVGVTGTTDSNGSFTLTLPVGSYSVVLAEGSTSFKSLTVPVVNVAAKGQSSISPVLIAMNPIAVSAKTVPNPAGFGVPATVAVNVTGGTAPYTYVYAFAKNSYLTKGVPNEDKVPAISVNADSSATFTTNSFADVVAGGKVVGLRASPRLGFIGVSTQQLRYMTYNLQVTVTDKAGFSNTALVGVPLSTLAQANQWVGKGTMVVLNTGAATPAWTIKSKPASSTAAVSAATVANPSFIPDQDGTYVFNDGTASPAGDLTVVAGEYVGSNSGCGTCHTTSTPTEFGPASADNNAVKFLADIYKEWDGSIHGDHRVNGVPTGKTLFQFVMQAGQGDDYAQNCMSCHTVGYNSTPSAANQGMDDLIKQTGWTFPSLPATPGADSAAPGTFDFWSQMPAPMQNLTGIQCESCHGPLSNHARVAASDPNFTQFTGAGMMASEVCAGCHDALGHHDRFQLWSQSWTNEAKGTSGHGHSRADLAVSETTQAGAATQSDCAKCHTGQGFNSWYFYQGPGSVQTHPEFLPSKTTPQTVMPIPAQAEPVTCQTCHDPHSAELRVNGSKAVYIEAFMNNPAAAPSDATKPNYDPVKNPGLPPSVYTLTNSTDKVAIQGAGAGGLCMVCHQSRRGLKDDQHPPKSVQAPHQGAQADVLYGRNFFFMSSPSTTDNARLGTPNPHALIPDTCFGCHGKYAKKGTTFFTTNHSFLIDSTVCSNCHGANMTAEGLWSVVEAGMSSIDVSAMKRVTALINASQDPANSNTITFWAVPYNTVTDKYSPKTVTVNGSAANAPVKFTLPGPLAIDGSGLALSDVHGQPGIALTLPAPVSVTWEDGTTTQVSTLSFQAGSLKDWNHATAQAAASDTNGLIGTTSFTNKGLWNYLVLEADKSKGVHNPSFTLNVITATQAALATATP